MRLKELEIFAATSSNMKVYDKMGESLAGTVQWYLEVTFFLSTSSPNIFKTQNFQVSKT